MLGRVVLDRYEITDLIGHGSMGEVWLAQDRRRAQLVAVKIMHAKFVGQPRFRDLFQREMQFMARFKHPHAVQLYDAKFDDPAGPCIVMEYIPGIGLDLLLEKHKTLPPDRVGNLLLQICKALNAAHEAGIVHRDMKPSNLMVVHADTPTESIKVMDLGLASLTAKPYIPLEKLQGSDEHRAVGTPAYISPEQLRGDEVDHRADIYALGVILFEMLTGVLPFDAESTMDLLHAHMHKPPPRFESVGAGHIEPRVEAVVQLCLSKYPIERPQSAQELAQRFNDALIRTSQLDPHEFEPSAIDLAQSTLLPVMSDNQRIVARLEAWMPEPIALVKLRGFVEDEGGRVTDSEPGLIRVRLGEPPPEPPKQKGLFGWLKRKPEPPSGPPPIAPIAIDLHMKKGAANRLDLTVVFRAIEGPLPFDSRWHDRCDKLLSDLRGYLMARK